MKRHPSQRSSLKRPTQCERNGYVGASGSELSVGIKIPTGGQRADSNDRFLTFELRRPSPDYRGRADYPERRPRSERFAWNESKGGLATYHRLQKQTLLLVFSRVLGEAGPEVCCLPVWGTYRAETRTSRWHGIQKVVLQHVKIAYYRLWML